MKVSAMFNASSREAAFSPEPRLLTHPNIPKPLHGVSPRTMLGKEWWDKTRREAYAKNNYHCYACGINSKDSKYHQWLEAHEDYDINYKTGEVKLKRIVALCHCCHSFIHSGLLEKKYDSGEIDYSRYSYILDRGRGILKKAGLDQWDGSFVTDFAEWGKWHLNIDGKKYFSKFKNIDEWRRFYAR